MKRRALLIGAPGSDLPGVVDDLTNLQNFLMSPLGGAWNASEVQVLTDPTKFDVLRGLAALNSVDYSFVFFGGHGRYNNYLRTTEVQLSSNVLLDVDVLKSGAPRHTVIVDACRVRHDGVLRKSLEHAMVMDSVEFSASAARQIFDERIQAAPAGLFGIYSCDVGEVANEEKGEGGLYTYSLVRAALDWKKGSRDRFSKSLSIKEAHDEATVSVVMRSGRRQNPKASYPRSSPYFPFAVLG